jgi:hypothetical protein
MHNLLTLWINSGDSLKYKGSFAMINMFSVWMEGHFRTVYQHPVDNNVNKIVPLLITHPVERLHIVDDFRYILLFFDNTSSIQPFF